MYESFYHLNAKPFQLKPDPDFFFGSRNHQRAMAYLQYGLSQAEGFIVITGEIGAGKTTLMRNLFRELDAERIVAAQIVTTHLGSDDTLKMVAAAFGIEFEGAGKAALLTRIERFLRDCEKLGKRALLVVDEAQNLSAQAIEELRMLSNFQTSDTPLLQTFLLGQPEFRQTIFSNEMVQLRQRIIATYHLGPMDADETRTYILHRLRTAGWQGDPTLSEDAFTLIHLATGGIPRKINSLCDRLFLMGFLEEIHAFGAEHVDTVVQDIAQEFQSGEAGLPLRAPVADASVLAHAASETDVLYIVERLGKIERALQFIVQALSKLLPSAKIQDSKEEPVKWS